MPGRPNSVKTQFKPGVRRGVAVKLYQPIGTERVSKDGYLERKVNDDMPLRQRWRAVHLIRWEEEHGPIPAGHCLKCLDGDRTNTDPENWACIPRALLPRLAGRWRMIFVCAHGDLFHENVPDEWIDRVFAVMALASQHTFQVLTKRPERARQYLSSGSAEARLVLAAMEEAPIGQAVTAGVPGCGGRDFVTH